MRAAVKILTGVGLGVAVCAPLVVPGLHQVPVPSESWLVVMALGGVVMGWLASRAGASAAARPAKARSGE